MDPRFAIVGGGLSGVASLDGLVRAVIAADVHNASITVFEPAAVIGPGRPYQVDQPYCWLLNYTANSFGTLNGGQLSFCSWMEANREMLSKEFALAMRRGWVPTDPTDGLIAVLATHYYPRNLFGMYLAASFKEIKKDAEARGIEVIVVPEKVDSIVKQKNNQLLVEDAQGNRYLFDQAILASGHTYAPRTSQFGDWTSYVSNIYAPDERNTLLALPASDKVTGPNLGTVAVKGTGLSANDAVLWLIEQKEQGLLTFDRILMVSRRGQLRKIRGKTEPYQMQHLTVEVLADKIQNEGTLSLDWVLDLFCKEMEAAYGGTGIDWQEIWNPRTANIKDHLRSDLEEATDSKHTMPWASVWAEFGKVRQGVFEHLSPEDKDRFFKEFNTIWSSYHAPMPPSSAERLLKAMDEGLLKVEAGMSGVVASKTCEQKYVLTFLEGENGRPFLTHARNSTELPAGVIKREVEVDFMIDAIGSTVDPEMFPAPYPSLLKAGLLTGHRWGGIHVDPQTLHPIKADGKQWEEIWQLGVNCQGDVLVSSNAVADISDGKRIGLSMIAKWTEQSRLRESKTPLKIFGRQSLVASV